MTKRQPSTSTELIDRDIDQLSRTIGCHIARWMHRLECKHNVLSDNPEESPLFCPGCGQESRVLGYSPYMDEEIT